MSVNMHPVQIEKEREKKGREEKENTKLKTNNQVVSILELLQNFYGKNIHIHMLSILG